MIPGRYKIIALTLLFLVLSPACAATPTSTPSISSLSSPVPTIPSSTASATRAIQAGTFTNPVLDQDFPDPDLLKVGGEYYAYATNGNDENIQVAQSTDLVHWNVLKNALPSLPPWTTQSFGWVWAPEVFSPKDGQYVMYFVAHFAMGNGGTQCIGVATSSDPAGPFESSSPDPFICQTNEGGSIDPAMFQDADGQRYVLWKNDGNSAGMQTWLYIQTVSADGFMIEIIFDGCIAVLEWWSPEGGADHEGAWVRSERHD